MSHHDDTHGAADPLSEFLILGRTPLMQQVAQLVRIAIAHPIPVLLCGQSGTGKERVAQAIHYGGARREQPFIPINCGALTEALLESELFGHRQGAFTGAVRERPGLFEVANGGTIFLDEIGDAPLALQVKLLRTLETGEVVPVGGEQARQVDVRLIAATHRDLESQVSRGAFRADLYYRINTLPIHLPPLAQRAEDIPHLAEQLLHTIAKRLGKAGLQLSDGAMACLAAYSWPGNVRELQNEIERAVALARPHETIAATLLSAKIRETRPRFDLDPAHTNLRRARRGFEEQFIRAALEHHGGNANSAAKALGISRSMLQRKIRAYGLRVPPRHNL